MSNTETYERVTTTILALIEKGELLPWQKPWKGSAEWARSMSSGKTYNGINRWMLTLTAQANDWSPWFGTYKQIAALGGQVRKGEKSQIAILWKPVEKVVNGDTEKFLLLRTFNVFSASQADGLPEKFYAKPDPVGSGNELDATADEVLHGYLGRESIQVTFGGNRACYSPRTDEINLPNLVDFLSSDDYYATAFHEAAHSTGHASRLNRPGIADFDHFGSHQYSREELVAELGSALVLGVLGLDKPNLVENQAAYLKHWKQALAADPQALVWAAGRAEKAADRILNTEAATAAPSASEGVS
jgi:antirestriction protein ArdC